MHRCRQRGEGDKPPPPTEMGKNVVKSVISEGSIFNFSKIVFKNSIFHCIFIKHFPSIWIFHQNARKINACILTFLKHGPKCIFASFRKFSGARGSPRGRPHTVFPRNEILVAPLINGKPFPPEI